MTDTPPPPTGTASPVSDPRPDQESRRGAPLGARYYRLFAASAIVFAAGFLAINPAIGRWGAHPVGVFVLASAMALAVVLVGRYGVLGLGLAFALAYVVASLWSLQVLGYKVPGFPIREVLTSLWRTVLASILMAEAVWLVAGQVGGNAGLDAALRVTVGTVVGVAVYVAVLMVLRAPELEAVRRRLQVGSTP